MCGWWQATGAAARKLAEHQALFAGNCDDHFRIGIKLTRCVCLRHPRQQHLMSQLSPQHNSKAWNPKPVINLTEFGCCRGAVRLYSEFLHSDVIVASPLGLTTLLTEAAGGGDASSADFLTSIEIAVAARADVLLMQNWMHVTEGGCCTTSIRHASPALHE